MIGDGDCGEIGAMKIGRGTEVLRENLPQCMYFSLGRDRPSFIPIKLNENNCFFILICSYIFGNMIFIF
jgi:hypothetical protein